MSSVGLSVLLPQSFLELCCVTAATATSLKKNKTKQKSNSDAAPLEQLKQQNYKWEQSAALRALLVCVMESLESEQGSELRAGSAQQKIRDDRSDDCVCLHLGEIPVMLQQSGMQSAAWPGGV